MPRPFVSVLIDTFNHEHFIEQAILSVLDQDAAATELEVLVVDDGSTDRTAEIVASFAPRVRLLRKPNGGQASAFNAAIPECQGEVVAFLDGDDAWCPGKLAAVLNTLEQHPEVGAVGHGFYETDEAGQCRDSICPDQPYRTFLRSIEEARQFVELRCFLGTSRLTVRRKVLEAILPVPPGLVIEADEYLATVATSYAGAFILDQPLTNYRIHAGNLYQFAALDRQRMARKLAVFQCLNRELPAALAAQGIAPEIISALTQHNALDADRMRLALGQGWSWESVRVERAAYRIFSPEGASLGYRFFHLAVLAVALVLPPRSFYKLRAWYDARRIARLRRFVGSAAPVPSLVVRKGHSG